MTKREKMNACIAFYNELAERLKTSYDIVGSCNQDISSYLVPKGTANQISYTSKPRMSFRISDHWNWYANVNKCSNEHYIQCYSVQIPKPKKRIAPGKASKPVLASQVCFTFDGYVYNVVYGEMYNFATREWEWVERTTNDVLDSIDYWEKALEDYKVVTCKKCRHLDIRHSEPYCMLEERYIMHEDWPCKHGEI